jgi:hypothetical protein
MMKLLIYYEVKGLICTNYVCLGTRPETEKLETMGKRILYQYVSCSTYGGNKKILIGKSQEERPSVT